ncbi:MAG: cation:proton antiporter [Methyloprofundus sp.]|nr:cation:proton antiporter [Methyloprofundus sp.]MDT8426124.1 cation:proton antiporter [Methyloprofundus sp.]
MDHLTLIIIALIFMGFGLLSGKIEGSLLTPPLLFSGLGLLFSQNNLALVDLHIDPEAIYIITEITLILVLFSDAARINLRGLKGNHNIPVRLLLIGMPLTIALGGILALWLPLDLNLWEAVLLAAILAPTDAALGLMVVTSEHVPVRIRQAINVESGLNDGIALPVVLIFVSLASSSQLQEQHDWVQFVVYQLGFGPLVGIFIGYLGAKVINIATQKDWMTESSEGLVALAIAALAYTLAESLHGNGFIAAFVAGLIFGNTLTHVCRFLFEFAETEGQLLTLVTFFIFGAVLLPDVLPLINGWILLYALLSLTIIRIIPVALSLVGAKMNILSTLFLGWFGPRGLASILFLLLILEQGHIEHANIIATITLLTISLSIIAHGISAAPFARFYGKKVATMGKCEEIVPVQEIPTRTGKLLNKLTKKH